jgi:Protein of unknown function (DUF1571)
LILLTLLPLVGCSTLRNRPLVPIFRGNSVPLRPLAIPKEQPAPAPPRTSTPEEPALLIPPPPELVALNREPSRLDVPTTPRAPTELAEPTLSSTRPLGAPALTASSNPAPAEGGLAAVKRIYREAVSRCAAVDAFEARLSRREFVDGKQEPMEVIRFQFRQKPLSIHMKWIGTEGQGREVVYVEGRFENKLHILMARGDLFPLSPPTRFDLAPDSDLIRAHSRHDVRDAGFASSVRQLGRALAGIDKNPALANRVSYRGKVQRPEYRNPLEAVEEVIAPGAESSLPRGGRRTTFYDPTPNTTSQGLPVVVITHDHTGREVEYYCFDHILHPIVLDDADFDPQRVFNNRR